MDGDPHFFSAPAQDRRQGVSLLLTCAFSGATVVLGLAYLGWLARLLWRFRTPLDCLFGAAEALGLPAPGPPGLRALARPGTPPG